MACAFCSKSGVQTREHIWPKWLHDAGNYSLKYHRGPDKVIPSEHVIRDVCQECNNGQLSALDAYGKTLHHRYFGKDYQTLKNVTFTYDYQQLVKWLLKIAYNSARAAHAEDADLLRLYAPHIIEPTSSLIFVHVSVLLMGQMIAIDPKSGVRTVTELRWCRNGPIGISETEAIYLSARTIMINCWCFILVIEKSSPRLSASSKMIQPILRGVELRRDSASLKIPTISLDPEGLLHHFRDKKHLYTLAANRKRAPQHC